MKQVNLPIQALDPELEPPSYANPGDAGLDLRSAEALKIAPGQRALVPCGIAVEIPEGYAGLVVPRSGLAIKNGITIVNAPGLIDSGYRGEIKVILHNTDANVSFKIERGDRIAQLLIVQTPFVNIKLAEKLTDTERGEGGFGSSGV